MNMAKADRRMKYVMLALCGALLIAGGITVAKAQGTLSIETTPAPTAGQVITKLTWAAPVGSTCTASGDWTGTKAASGTETLPAAVPPKNYALSCVGTGDTGATLSWVAPTTNVDGSPLAKCATATTTGSCLARFRVCRGASATTTTDCRNVSNPNATGTPWSGGITPGTHFFAVKAVTGDGVESVFSNAISKTATAGVTWTASVGVTVPNAPASLTVE